MEAGTGERMALPSLGAQYKIVGIHIPKTHPPTLTAVGTKQGLRTCIFIKCHCCWDEKHWVKHRDCEHML